MAKKYDDASWHYDGDFPEDSPIEYGGVHIALFLKWCLQQGWASDDLTELASGKIQNVIDGTMSATEFLFEFCDGKLIDSDLTDDGNNFAVRYYETDKYFKDFARQYGELMYVAPEKDFELESFSRMLDKKFAKLTSTKSPWWKFW